MPLSRMLIAVLVLFAWNAAAETQKLPVVASFSILADMTREIGGDAVSVIAFAGPGKNTHHFEPSPSDAAILRTARLVIVNGLGFDDGITRFLRAAEYSGPVVVASQGVVPLQKANAPDPHAWQSIENAKIYAGNIRDALISADPARAALYRDNAANYLKKLQALDKWTRSQIDAVPPACRRVIVLHDGFDYFARDYNIELLSPTAGEPSARDIAMLTDALRTGHVKSVFMENSHNDSADRRLLEQLVHDDGAVAGEALYADALSGPEGPAGTYPELFRINVERLAQGMKVCSSSGK